MCDGKFPGITAKSLHQSLWKWPEIEGLHSFKGKLVHSADWDHDYNYSNKRVALIGNGSSGIQILPQLAATEGTEVTSFQRGPTWVTSRMSPASLLGRDDPDPNPRYTEEDKQRFRKDPEYHHQYRKQLIHRVNKAFRMVPAHRVPVCLQTNEKVIQFLKGSPENLDATQYAIKQMSAKLNYRKDLCDMLIPTWELGCRRVTPGEGYLESFLRPNVSLTQSPITKVTEDSVCTADGMVYEIDISMCHSHSAPLRQVLTKTCSRLRHGI